MITRLAILGAFVLYLVCFLFYCISPGEVEIAYAGIKRKISGAEEHLTSAVSGRGRTAPETVAVIPFGKDIGESMLISMFALLPVIAVCSALLISLLLKRREETRRRRFVDCLERALTGSTEIHF